MASSDRTPLGYRRNDPDETEGRLLYRQRADAGARMEIAMTRKVRLADARERSDTGHIPRSDDPPREHVENDLQTETGGGE